MGEKIGIGILIFTIYDLMFPSKSLSFNYSYIPTDANDKRVDLCVTQDGVLD